MEQANATSDRRVNFMLGVESGGFGS